MAHIMTERQAKHLAKKEKGYAARKISGHWVVWCNDSDHVVEFDSTDIKQTAYNFTATVAELELGDVVKLFDGAFGTGIVKQIADGFVTMFRPYGASEDFAYSGGVICYTGVEEYKFSLTDKSEIFVYQRKLNLA